MANHPRVTQPIIFFDGVCGMCNAVVNQIMRLDTRQVFLFAPLQGTTARQFLPPLSDDANEWSISYVDASGVYDQSDAALRICRRLGGGWALFGVLRCLPRSVRNALYRYIARNRYRWFGKHDTCRIPTPAERARFLP